MEPATLHDPAGIAPLLAELRGRRIVALVGAGCSTESGIPDYRGPTSRERPPRPVQYQDFVRSDVARARYWARSTVGWPRITAARPNAAHHVLARLEDGGLVTGIITQNVDGLHQAAGSRNVLELHGSLAWVRCLACGAATSRAAFQERLLALNPAWAERVASVTGGVAAAPDGDAELPDEAMRTFRVPECERCGGIVKPDVVFFGENVPRERVDRAWRLLAEGDVLLVVGSSLAVYSGRRFTERARQEGKPIVIINIGPTRADEWAAAKLEGRVGEVLPRLAHALLDPWPQPERSAEDAAARTQ